MFCLPEWHRQRPGCYTDDMHKIFSTLIASFTLIVLAAAPVAAASPNKTHGGGNASTSTLLGNDVSWPQCSSKLPAKQAFGIVGVNDGLANTTNPCFATELAWANRSVGGTGQPLVALYVNTANPGLQGSWWPTSNEYPAGTVVTNPYGTCAGANDQACAFMYGYAKAYDDVNSRGVTTPSAYTWWLDVETGNTWQTDTVANMADLEGMTTYFTGIGAKVGLYSTSYQWGQITGTVSTTSNLNGLPSWIPGARSQSGAASNCALPPLTTGGKVTLTQFVSKNLDYDYSCI